MGEAKRRKKLDPNFGKNNKKEPITQKLVLEDYISSDEAKLIKLKESLIEILGKETIVYYYTVLNDMGFTPIPSWLIEENPWLEDLDEEMECVEETVLIDANSNYLIRNVCSSTEIYEKVMTDLTFFFYSVKTEEELKDEFEDDLEEYENSYDYYKRVGFVLSEEEVNKVRMSELKNLVESLADS